MERRGIRLHKRDVVLMRVIVYKQGWVICMLYVNDGICVILANISKSNGLIRQHGYDEPRPMLEEKDMTAIYYFCFYIFICTKGDICTYMMVF